MKTTKLVLGILSIVLSMLVMFQSCAAGIGNAIAAKGETSGSSGFLLAFFLMAGGIVGIVARGSKGGAIASTILYFLGGLIGISNVGTYKDLQIWSVMMFILCAIFAISIFVQKYPSKKVAAEQLPEDQPTSVK